MTSRDAARRDLLGLANMDVHDLFEAVWRMNRLFRENDPTENRKLAEDLLRELLADDLISLNYTKKVHTSPGHFELEVTPIASDAIHYTLAADESWEPVEFDVTGVGFVTTDKGMRVWHSSPAEDETPG